ncbi:MAG: hypothetical protein ACRC10_08090 [Thermoguttaceae bacterium]
MTQFPLLGPVSVCNRSTIRQIAGCLLFAFSLFLSNTTIAQVAAIGFDELSAPTLSIPGSHLHPKYADIPSDQSANQTPQPIGALLLKTGYVTLGTATLERNVYQVQGKYGRFSVPTHRVEYAGYDLLDLLQYKRSLLVSPNYDELFALGKWCLANGLNEEAIVEFQRCKSFVSVPQAIRLLDNEIRAAERTDPQFRQHSKLDAVLREEASQNLDDFDYDRWGLTVPHVLAERFRKEVQPILIDRCAATNCHGSGSQNELTLQIPQRTYSTAGATVRNMKAAMEQIDFGNPVNSPLLTAPLRNHGGVKPVFGKKSQNTQGAFERWIEQVAQETPESLGLNRRTPNRFDDELPFEESRTEQFAVSPQPLPTGSPIQQVGYSEPKPVGPTTDSGNLKKAAHSPTQETKPLAQPRKLKLENRAEDPFDPNQFNQKYYK